VHEIRIAECHTFDGESHCCYTDHADANECVASNDIAYNELADSEQFNQYYA
jgi:hypothetical protein